MSTVMLVEDDPDVREAMTLALDECGVNAMIAANGELALEQLGAGPLPSLILLDLMMPVMDGREMHRALRADPRLALIPVVVLSAQDDVRAIAHEMGAAGWLRKPIGLPALLKTLQAHVPGVTT